MADTQALVQWLRTFAELVAENRERLTQLDAAIGDADHGSNMHRGMTAVVASIDEQAPATAGALMKLTGITLVSKVGGASGPLFGTFFLRMGTALGEESDVDVDQLAAAMRAGLDGVAARGKAEPGDKTMLDALGPAVEAFEAGGELGEVAGRAREAATAGCAATVDMAARRGRASYLGERSVGHQDPGATSVELLMQAASRALT